MKELLIIGGKAFSVISKNTAVIGAIII